MPTIAKNRAFVGRKPLIGPNSPVAARVYQCRALDKIAQSASQAGIDRRMFAAGRARMI
jgi:hypothetical protein